MLTASMPAHSAVPHRHRVGMPARTPRFVVLENSQSDIPAQRAAAEFGRPVYSGWRGVPGRVCVGRLCEPAQVADVVLAALAGADLVVDVQLSREATDLLCDDLRRLGFLDHRVLQAPPVQLDADQRALLAVLAGGVALGAAAAALHLSRRTADRRLAAAKARLGATSTAQAIVRARQLGLLDELETQGHP